jgi:hypothetical protein
MSVEIRALKVGRKQMTVTLFKQLREHPLIDGDGYLQGTPWGIVNHHPDRCESPGHQHIVWVSAQGGDLLRHRLSLQPDFDLPDQRQEPFECEQADRMLSFRVHEWLQGRLEEAPLHKGLLHYNASVMYSVADLRVQATMSTAAFTAAEARRKVTDPGWSERPVSAGWVRPPLVDPDDALSELAAEVTTWGGTYEEVYAEFEAAVQQELDRRERHRDLHRTLAKLPQLFIGV